jgi:hypothetical protein
MNYLQTKIYKEYATSGFAKSIGFGSDSKDPADKRSPRLII